jgi:hypothetical protein
MAKTLLEKPQYKSQGETSKGEENIQRRKTRGQQQKRSSRTPPDPNNLLHHRLIKKNSTKHNKTPPIRKPNTHNSIN